MYLVIAKGNISLLENKYECPESHKYAYNNGEWCCNINEDCRGNDLKIDSQCCQYSAYIECPTKESGKKCKSYTNGMYN